MRDVKFPPSHITRIGVLQLLRGIKRRWRPAEAHRASWIIYNQHKNPAATVGRLCGGVRWQSQYGGWLWNERVARKNAGWDHFASLITEHVTALSWNWTRAHSPINILEFHCLYLLGGSPLHIYTHETQRRLARSLTQTACEWKRKVFPTYPAAETSK